MADSTMTAAAEPVLQVEGTVAILHLGAGENRFSGESVARINACLDEVEAGDAQALVTVAEGKIWSNGLDQHWLAAHPDIAASAVRATEALLGRLLGFPMPTVAAVQGHAFAAGMMFALCHDLRVMRRDRGYLCLPEVDLGVRFTPGMNALLTGRMSAASQVRGMVWGERFDATTAHQLGLIEETAELDQVRERAIEQARARGGRPRAVVANLKQDVHREALALLGASDPPAELVAAVTAAAG